jgi:hypothetical protein
MVEEGSHVNQEHHDYELESRSSVDIFYINVVCFLQLGTVIDWNCN